MAKNVLVGVNNVARKPSYIYVGVDGKARKVKAIYAGVNGIARQCWPAGILPNNYTQLEYLDQTLGINTDVKTTVKPRIIMEFSMVNNTSYGYYASLSLITADSREYYGADNWCGYYVSLNGDGDGCFLVNGQTWNESSSAYTYDVSFKSNNVEKTLLNTTYRLDFLNGNNVYLYNTEGYYSIASNNLLGSISKQSLVAGSVYVNGTIILNSVSRQFGVGRMKSFNIKMYNGSTLIRDYYPCYRNSDKYLGYYDTVNKIFYPAYYTVSSDPSYNTPIKYDDAIDDGYLIGPVV